MQDEKYEEYSIKRFLKSKRLIGTSILFLLGEFFSNLLSDYFLDKEILSIFDHKLSFGVILCVVIFIIFVVYLIFECSFDLIKHAKREYKNAQNLKDEYKNRIIELNSQRNKEKGEEYFRLALGLDTYEPVKFDLLEEAATKHHHIYSAMYIGNLYHNGLRRGEKVIFEKNNAVSFEMYKSVIDYDTYGVALWKVGWMLERGQAPECTDNEEENQRNALKYYEESAKLGYAKAFNSIGKFYQFGLGGKNVDRVEAISNYKIADEKGDIYATLNKAYIHCQNEDEFPLAEECFTKAIKTGSPLAHLKFAAFINDNWDYFKFRYSRLYILELLCLAANSNNGSDAARAYYLIGKLFENDIDNYGQHIAFVSEKLSINSLDNFHKECYRTALKMFENLYYDGVKLNNTSKRIYAELIMISE